MMRCPGQDMRYWRGDAAFELACPRCGIAVEFFKDESFRRCCCGHAFPNPRIRFDCAQWCEYAEKCLGAAALENTSEVAPEGAFSARLLEAIDDWFSRNDDQISPSLLIFQHARQILPGQPCNGRIVLASALMLELQLHLGGVRSAQNSSSGAGTVKHWSEAEQLLHRVGMDQAEIDRIRELLQYVTTRGKGADVETNLLLDAIALAQLTTAFSRGRIEEVKSSVVPSMRTKSGRERAVSLFGG